MAGISSFSHQLATAIRASRAFETLFLRRKVASLCLETAKGAVIDRTYSSGISPVGAVYDRAMSARESFETETS